MKTALKAITGLFVLLAAIYGLTWTGVRADDVQGNCEGDPSPIPCETEDEPCGPLPDPVPVGPLVPVRSGDNLQISVIKVLDEDVKTDDDGSYLVAVGDSIKFEVSASDPSDFYSQVIKVYESEPYPVCQSEKTQNVSVVKPGDVTIEWIIVNVEN